MRGADILVRAKQHLGETYILGAHAPLANKNWTGPWDCAEYASWLAYQTYGIVYGCGSTTVEGADPFSGFWADDAQTRGVLVSVAEATATAGAFLVRVPQSKPTKMIGHVAISIGDGQVYEAAGAKVGVRVGPIAGRRWDMGVLLPGVEYDSGGTLPVSPTTGTASRDGLPLIFRRQDPATFDDHVVEIQAALKERGYDPGKIDGLFGAATEAAAYSFQIAEGLVPDGEVGPTTGRALGLAFWPSEPDLMTMTAPALGGPSAVASIRNDDFGAIVSTSTAYGDLQAEYAQLFAGCVVQDKHGEIAELCRRIAANRDRYAAFVSSFRGQPNQDMPWFFVALIHAMEASGDVGRFKTHLHNGDPLVRPTVHIPRNRPTPDGANFTWEESAKDALECEQFDKETDWSLPRMLFRLEQYNGMGSRKRGHATAYLWSYSNHYIKGKYVADNVWDDNAVSRQPGAGAILKQLVDDHAVEIG